MSESGGIAGVGGEQAGLGVGGGEPEDSSVSRSAVDSSAFVVSPALLSLQRHF